MIDPTRFYLTDDPDLTAIWPQKTLANWRHEGRGPTYHKAGKRVMYRGSDLLEFIERHRVETDAA